MEQVQVDLHLPTPGVDGNDPQQVLSVSGGEQVHCDLPMGAEGTLVPEDNKAHHPATNQDSEKLVHMDRPDRVRKKD